ncbi:hypothetical protein BDE40_1750 [Litoreibacter halocynthiae]|uniref:Acetolactate synthase n=1 Tax=Litoreibacter halocynthiae TaxID=1242689 RepID=A0A4R7LK39_9RHOB|nr:DUF6497 family protein [Litoreibacter halocynthiae]TDT75026.1 hypothetical protein BDE40_1750 [Litoreibacter halocynthiae]
MKLAALILGIATGAASADQAPLQAVSAVEYLPHEVLFEPPGTDDPARRIVRIRLLAPQIVDQKQFGFDVIESDFQALCESEGLRIVAESAPNAREIVVSVASEAMPFGESAPNVVQYFDLFAVVDGTCVWGGL